MILWYIVATLALFSALILGSVKASLDNQTTQETPKKYPYVKAGTGYKPFIGKAPKMRTIDL